MNDSIMNDSIINDIRILKDFKSITFSGFSRSKVKKELLNCINISDIESSCYWSIELICAGHFNDLWDVLLLYMSRYIHVGNPKLPIYMDMRFQNFKTVISNGFIDNELELRNTTKIRTLFAELICILCYSRKKHAFESFSIKDTNDFNMTNMTSRLKAPNIRYIESFYQKEDPKELFIAINEFSYNISRESKDATKACYWVEWILQFDTLCKNKKIKCECERRQFVPVDSKYQMETVWLLWNSLINESKKRENKAQNKIINALLNLYCIKFTPGVKKRRKYLIYSAISYLTEDIKFTIPLVENKKLIESITSKINILYKEKKKEEITPKTDYLFTGLEKSNKEKSLEKMEMLEKMNPINKF